jgi:hypothetical protein
MSEAPQKSVEKLTYPTAPITIQAPLPGFVWNQSVGPLVVSGIVSAADDTVNGFVRDVNTGLKTSPATIQQPKDTDHYHWRMTYPGGLAADPYYVVAYVSAGSCQISGTLQ